MLVLTRYSNESIVIGGAIKVTVLAVERSTGRVKVGITAPENVTVYREEVLDKIKRNERRATGKE